MDMFMFSLILFLIKQCTWVNILEIKKNYVTSGHLITKAIKKYPNRYEKIILEENIKFKSDLNATEQMYISLFYTFKIFGGMNLTTGGDSFLLSEETKNKMSISHKGKKQSPEHIAKKIEFHTGRKNSSNAIDNMKKAIEKRIKENPEKYKAMCSNGGKQRKGKKMSEEQKHNMSKAQKKLYAEMTAEERFERYAKCLGRQDVKEKISSKEYIEKRAKSRKLSLCNMSAKERSNKFGIMNGKKHTESTKELMRKSAKAYIEKCKNEMSEEQFKIKFAHRLGQQSTEEHKTNIRESNFLSFWYKQIYAKERKTCVKQYINLIS